MEERALRFGVIGLNFGRQHARALVNMEDVELVAIASPHDAGLPGGLKGYAAKYGVKAYHDGLELLQKEKLDAACIVTMPKGREPMLEYAVKNKIALFVLK